MALVLRDNFRLQRIKGGTQDDLEGASAVKAALVKVAHVDADTFVATEEVSGTNYTAGGIAITLTVTLNGSTVEVDTGTQIKWLQHAAGFADARKLVLYVVADGEVIGIEDFGASENNTAHDLELVPAAAGFFTSP